MAILLHDLTPANIAYLNDDSRFIITAAGRRSRKTLIGDWKMLFQKDRGAFFYPDQQYFFCAPTQQQAKRIFWKRLMADTKGYQKDVSKTDSTIILWNGSQLTVAGLDKPERIEGQTEPPIAGIHITEMANIKPGAWNENIRPVLSDTGGFAIVDGVPEGHNHYYDFCLRHCNGVIPKAVPMKGAQVYNDPWSFHTWHSADILPIDEIQELRSSMDVKTFRQEYEGSFEGYAGLVYDDFNSDNIKPLSYNPSLPLYIGMDFGWVDPSVALWIQYDAEIKTFYVLKEFVRSRVTTSTLSDIVLGKTVQLSNGEFCSGFPISRIDKIITGSESKQRRQEADGASNFSIMTTHGIPQYLFKIVNRRVVNTIMSVRSKVRTANNEVRLFVDESCTKTINDFYAWHYAEKDGILQGESPDQSAENHEFSHTMDALRYVVDYIAPLRSEPKWKGVT